MLNWLGQDIQPGDIVYRGARQGDGSSFRVGEVKKINEESRKVTVKWTWEGSTLSVCHAPSTADYREKYESTYTLPGGTENEFPSAGSPTIDSVIKIDPSVLDFLKKQAQLIKAARHYRIKPDDFEKFRTDFYEGRVAFIDTP